MIAFSVLSFWLASAELRAESLEGLSILLSIRFLLGKAFPALGFARCAIEGMKARRTCFEGGGFFLYDYRPSGLDAVFEGALFIE